MKKNKYAKRKARKEFVKDFISKMDSVSVKDVSLIPALMDYVETGNKRMFDEYLDFHFIKDEEKKIRELKDAEARIEKAKNAKAVIEETFKKLEVDYEEAIVDYRNWRHQVLSQVDTDTKFDNAKAIKEFLSVLDGIPHPERRYVYVLVGDKMLKITSARLSENNRIVFGTEGAFAVPTPPIHPDCLYDYTRILYF